MSGIISTLSRLWLFGLAAWTLGLMFCMSDVEALRLFSFLIVIWELLAALGLLILIRILKMGSIS